MRLHDVGLVLWCYVVRVGVMVSLRLGYDFNIAWCSVIVVWSF